MEFKNLILGIALGYILGMVVWETCKFIVIIIFATIKKHNMRVALEREADKIKKENENN